MDRDLFIAIRRYTNKTQVEFAKWIGVSTPTVALFESGHRNISEATKSKLARKFDINDPDFLAYCKRRNNIRRSV